MGRKLMFGVQELFCTFFSVVYLHFGQVKIATKKKCLKSEFHILLYYSFSL